MYSHEIEKFNLIDALFVILLFCAPVSLTNFCTLGC